jgi:hypothetical protein
MAERAKDSGPEWNGLRTGPRSSFFDTSRSTPRDGSRLLSQPTGDQSSDLISSRDNYPVLAESETMMSLLGESESYENARERWEADRQRRRKWSIATKMTVIALVALVGTAGAMAIRLVFFEKNKPSADVAAPQIVVPRQTAAEAAPAVARQSGETLQASAEPNRPRNPANGLNTGLTPDDAAADPKSVGRVQNAPPQALAARQSPATLADREELANGLTPGDIAADPKSAGRRQNAPPQASAARPSPARLIDREELANLLRRGRYLLSIGDIAPARLLLERAADAHEASAAFDLAGTYDPAVLARSHLSGIAPDLAMARMWYEKALSLGHPEAQQRLAQLQK